MTGPLYMRDGSRFVPLPDVLLRDCPPIPVPAFVTVTQSDGQPDTAKPWRVAVPAPRCPHGHFRRCPHCTTPLERTRR